MFHDSLTAPQWVHQYQWKAPQITGSKLCQVIMPSKTVIAILKNSINNIETNIWFWQTETNIGWLNSWIRMNEQTIVIIIMLTHNAH